MVKKHEIFQEQIVMRYFGLKIKSWRRNLNYYEFTKAMHNNLEPGSADLIHIENGDGMTVMALTACTLISSSWCVLSSF